MNEKLTPNPDNPTSNTSTFIDKHSLNRHGNVILYESLSDNDKNKCQSFPLKRGALLAVNIESGELVGVDPHTMAQIDAYLMHGSNYNMTPDAIKIEQDINIINLSKKYRKVDFN